MRNRGLLKRLAARLARDQPIDWGALEHSADADAERDTLQELRVVAAVAGFYRTVQAGDASEDLSSSVSLARSVASQTTGTVARRESREPQLASGSRWSHLEILERVGRGAFGEVYRARDTRLDRVVALKILFQESAAPAEETVREARLLARVRHPHVVTVHGADRVGGHVGIWMEFLEGESLDQVLRSRGAFDPREAALIGIDLCRALSAVHAAGIIHRDVKLGNVMRAAGGRIVLMDFGLGRETRTSRDRAPRTLSGTPLFMAPEVLRGSRADARSDVYSLGVVLFSLVTGTQPVKASSLSGLIAKHERGELKRSRDLRPDLPEAFARVLDHTLAPEPSDRFETPGEAEQALLQALGTTVQDEATPVRSPRWKRLAAIGAAGIVAIAGTWVLLQPRRGSENALVVPVPLPSAPTLELLGEHSEDMFGLAVAGVGDVDQDGFDDVLVGAPQSSEGAPKAGKIYWYRGTRTGLESKPAWTAVGTEPEALLGWSIASFTNLALDGFDDLVVGMPGWDPKTPRRGSVVIYNGSSQGPSREPVQTLAASTTGTLFGYAVSTGDVNHDGHDDLLVGEPGYPSHEESSGRAYLFLANQNAYSESPVRILSGPPHSQFGITVSIGDDVNGDGYADAVIGANTASFGAELSQCGAAYVYLGSATGLDSIPTVLPGRQPGENFGYEAFFAGDLDADGFADLVVGAENGSHGEESEGIAEIYFGSSHGISPHGAVLLESNTMGANFGGHAGRVGDLDGDGCDDLFIGAIRYQKTQPREGAVFLFRGSRRREISRSWFRARGKAGSWYGTAGGSAGDLNADGFPDFIVSSGAWDTDKGINVGQVEVYLNTRKR